MSQTHTLGHLGAAAMAVAGLLLFTAPAVAHTSLADSSPKDGATLDEPPGEVTLEFTEAVQRDFTQIAVLDADVAHYEDGEPVVAGSTVTQAVHELPAGEYRISYRIGSPDGHPVTGVITFAVASQVGAVDAQTQPAEQTQPPQQTESPTPIEQPSAAEAPASDNDESGSSLRWLGAGAAVAAAAALLFALLRRPGGGAPRTESDTGPQ